MLYRSWGSSSDEASDYTNSIHEDAEITEQVKLTMKAHVISLFLSGTVDKPVTRDLIKAINSFKEVKQGYEDVHEALEDHLIKEVGEPGGWVGLARSRNDHVATALRLKTRDLLDELLNSLLTLREALLSKAEENKEVIFPVYTHFQLAQPSTLSHYLLYIEEELSSRWRNIFSELSQLNRSPLGSGAIVGTNLKVDRQKEATMLGFDDIVYNTISATASRSDIISVVLEVANLMVSMSRIAEDMVLLSSNMIDVVQLPDSHVSTSSLMPHKRNAVTMETLRAKAGLIIGEVTSILSIYKGTPSGYDLDLQEMNLHYWNVLEEAIRAVKILKSAISGMVVKREVMDVKSLSTDEAELTSIQNKVPYRKAYFDVASRIKQGSYQSNLKPQDSIRMKAVIGSPNPDLITEEIKTKRKFLSQDREKLTSFSLKVRNGMNLMKVIEDDLLQE
ncbi:argininosuccinate lyase [Sulfuracidifex tepidarius]|uniref:Argininosuccinate lyase n=1 Tax=Sulfuracidifex tepidarius TaxID=1294262 RepID=A0A510DVR3_9CREN|nr:argininosuccinate lyase [Sulfuracidifex tepidarius]BBG24058.1 Fumarate hydratase class II [Sulfuracidifex tepidarius]BBG26813.1 Fumarate hydratase class II [Sulfuracidifex tepidarius]